MFLSRRDDDEADDKDENEKKKPQVGPRAYLSFLQRPVIAYAS